MIEERLKEVLWDCTGMDADNHPSIIEAMKQAVNEALEEAAENAELKNEFKSQPGHGTKAGGGAWRETMVDKQSILNLKVK